MSRSMIPTIISAEFGAPSQGSSSPTQQAVMRQGVSLRSNEGGLAKHPRSGNQITVKGKRKRRLNLAKKNAIDTGAIAIGSVTLEESVLVSADEQESQLNKAETVDDFGAISLNQDARDLQSDIGDATAHSGDLKQVQLTNYQNFFFASRPIPQTAELHNGRQRFDSVEVPASNLAQQYEQQSQLHRGAGQPNFAIGGLAVSDLSTNQEQTFSQVMHGNVVGGVSGANALSSAAQSQATIVAMKQNKALPKEANLVTRPVAVPPLTTKCANLTAINFEKQVLEDVKDYEGMPKNGSGDNLSTLSQSPPLVLDSEHPGNEVEVPNQKRVVRKTRQKKSITQEQFVFDPATHSQQASMAKPNPYVRAKPTNTFADAGQRHNFQFLNDVLPQSFQQRDSFSLPRKMNTPHSRSILPVPTIIRGKQSKSPILDYIKGNEFIKNCINRAQSKNSNPKNHNTNASKVVADEASTSIPSPMAVQSPANNDGEKKSPKLSFVNPEKFIVQNNFIPVPSILMNQGASSQLHPVGQGQAQKFIESGENLTQERFTKSRQRKQRGAPSRVVVPLFSNHGMKYNRNLSLGSKGPDGSTSTKGTSLTKTELSASKARPSHSVFKPANQKYTAVFYGAQLTEPAEQPPPKFPPPQTSAAMRAHQYFGFGSRLSNDSISGGGSHSGDSGYHRVVRHNDLTASQAASEEQGNSSMCSFDGFFINITEEQLNQVNRQANTIDDSSFPLCQPQQKKRRNKAQQKEASPTHSETSAFQLAFEKNKGSYRSSLQSLSGRSRMSNRQLHATIQMPRTTTTTTVPKLAAKKPTLTKKQVKLQNLKQAVLILQKNQIQMTESRAQISDSHSPARSDRSDRAFSNKKAHKNAQNKKLTLPVALGQQQTKHGGQSKKMSTHTLGSTGSLKAVYMGKTFHSLKPPGSPSHTNAAAVNVLDQRVVPKAAFQPAHHKKSNQSFCAAASNAGIGQSKKQAGKRQPVHGGGGGGAGGLRGIKVLSDQNISFQDNKLCLLSPFQERHAQPQQEVVSTDSSLQQLPSAFISVPVGPSGQKRYHQQPHGTGLSIARGNGTATAAFKAVVPVDRIHLHQPKVTKLRSTSQNQKVEND